jgi:hypothetical protein
MQYHERVGAAQAAEIPRDGKRSVAPCPNDANIKAATGLATAGASTGWPAS